MSALGNQTLANERTAYYLRRGEAGIPSPLVVVDENGPTLGSTITLATVDSVGTLINKDPSGNVLSTMTMDASGDVSIATENPPTEGYNIKATDNQVRVAVPLVVQHGTNGGCIMSNDGAGNAYYKNSITAPGNIPASIVMDQLGNVCVGGAGNGTANQGGMKFYTYNGGANSLAQMADPGSQKCVQIVAGGLNLLDAASVTRGRVSLNGSSEVNIGGPNLNLFANQDTTPIQVIRGSSSNMTLTHPSNITMAVGGSNRIFASTAGMDLLGSIGIPPTAGSINMNGNPINTVGSLTFNNGGTINGLGTINMANSGGFASGTINGLSNMNTAGNQPITITGYNPGSNTPLITLGSAGGIVNQNYAANSVLNDVTLTSGGISLASTSSGNSFLIQNLFMMYPSTSPAGDRAGGDAITVFDFANKPPGSYYMYFFSGEGGFGVVYTYWSGTTIGTPSVNYNNNGYQNRFDVPKNGTTTQIGYAYFSHAAQGEGVSFVVRVA